jgi:ABC-type bacteriocin/lantibiotic exporter with double-glycine peptidase domain
LSTEPGSRCEEGDVASVIGAALCMGLATMLGLVRPAAPQVPEAHRIAGVPLAERQSNWCGPAALAAVLQYHGAKVTAKEIADEIYLSDYRGTLNLDLLVYARKLGFRVRAEKGSAEGVRQAVADDLPVVCMVRSHGRIADTNHYVVVRGFKNSRKTWLIDSGAGEESAVSEADFMRTWEECGRWMLVVEGKAKGDGGE